jgi:cytochrome c oxidase subunit 2
MSDTDTSIAAADGMRVDLYEKIWMWGVAAMLAVFFGTTVVVAIHGSVHPPSHVETIDPGKALADARFRRQGVWVDAAGKVQASIVALAFAWLPPQMTIPADTPVTFHLTSIDVVHGFEIVRTNGQAIVVPGYVSQFTTRFAPGEYMIVCNEYCGVGHHTMAGKLTVVPRAAWQGVDSAHVSH